MTSHIPSTPITAPREGMNIVLWVLQLLLAVAFLMAGGFKLSTPTEALVAQGMTAPVWSLRLAGISEVLGALGLILPSLLRVQPKLTPIAAALLALIMGLAIATHLAMSQFAAIVAPGVLSLLCSFVAWGRFKAVPISPKRG